MSRQFRPLKSKDVINKIKQLSSPQQNDCTSVVNRNPRNLERLCIAYKPKGYHLEKFHSYWHKLEVNETGRYVTAEIRHFENGPVVTASTSEWVIKKQLYKTKDSSAFINLGHVFAQRCMRSGITEISCTIESIPGSKMAKFLNTLKENGITLKEPNQLKCPAVWDKDRPEKTWEPGSKLAGQQTRT